MTLATQALLALLARKDSRVTLALLAPRVTLGIKAPLVLPGLLARKVKSAPKAQQPLSKSAPR